MGLILASLTPVRRQQAIRGPKLQSYYTACCWVHAVLQKGKVVMKSREMMSKGFTLVEIMIVVALIGLLAAIAMPSWVRARTTSQTNACINNLRQIFGAT